MQILENPKIPVSLWQFYKMQRPKIGSKFTLFTIYHIANRNIFQFK